MKIKTDVEIIQKFTAKRSEDDIYRLILFSTIFID